MKKLVLFGTGKISDVLADYFERDSDYEIVAYTCEAAHVTGKEHRGRPLIAFDEIERQFAPASHAMHIAVGYHQMNRVRERLLNAARAKGYKLPSFISTRSWPGPSLACGDNCFVADGASVEPQARVGENVALWSNVLVGHHAEIAQPRLARGWRVDRRRIEDRRALLSRDERHRRTRGDGRRGLPARGALAGDQTAGGGVGGHRSRQRGHSPQQ